MSKENLLGLGLETGIRILSSDEVYGYIEDRGALEGELRRVRREAALTLLEARGPISLSRLGKIAERHKRTNAGTGDKRTSVRNSVRRLQRGADEWENVSFLSVCIADWYAGHIRTVGVQLEVPSDDLHGAIREAKATIRTWANQACSLREQDEILLMCRGISRRVASALTKGAEAAANAGVPRSISDNMLRAADFVSEKHAANEAASEWLSSDDPTRHMAQLEDVQVETWVVVKLIRYLAKRLFDWDTLVNVYAPTPGGNIVVLVSSLQVTPGRPPGKFQALPVAAAHLAGGAAIAAETHLAVSVATVENNSNHEEKGRPAQYISVPIAYPTSFQDRRPHYPSSSLDRRPRYGQLSIGVVKDGSPKVSVQSNQVLSVFLCVADYLRDRIGGPDPISPWHATIREPGSFKDLERALIQRLLSQQTEEQSGTGAGKFEGSLVRDVYHIVAAVPAEGGVPDTVRGPLEYLARGRALRISRGSKVYSLTQPGAYVFLAPDMEERDWQTYRDGDGTRSNSLPLYQATAHRCQEASRLAGSIQEFKVTWHRSSLLAAHESWELRSIVQTIGEQLNKTARNVSHINELSRLYGEGNYLRALAVAYRLRSSMGPAPTCGTVFNDLSRLALHCRYPKEAARFALERIKFAPWELTPHANLLLGYLADRDLVSAQQHIATCQYCQEHRRPNPGQELPDPNALLTASLAMFDLTTQEDPKATKWAEEQFERALEVLAQRLDPLSHFVSTQIVLALAVGSDKSFEQHDPAGIVWELDMMRPGGDWREIEALRRVAIAAAGAHTSLVPPGLSAAPRSVTKVEGETAAERAE